MPDPLSGGISCVVDLYVGGMINATSRPMMKPATVKRRILRREDHSNEIAADQPLLSATSKTWAVRDSPLNSTLAGLDNVFVSISILKFLDA